MSKFFQNWGWWITLPVVLLAIVPQAFTKGMFMDGIMYATLAHNYFLGEGELWKPFFSTDYYPIFFEHPPLVFALHGYLYSLFGDGFYMDKLYAVVINLLTVLVLYLIWNKTFENKPAIRSFSWLPILLWISIPRVFWAYHNNVLDITMGLFSTASVYSLLFVGNKFSFRAVSALTIASVFLLMAFLSKGFVGLFPLSFLFWKDVLLEKKNIKIIALKSSALVLTFSTIACIFFLTSPEALTCIQTYLETQVKQSLAGERETDNRFFIIKTLLTEALFPILLSVASIIYGRFKFQSTDENVYQRAYLFLALGLSGIIPIMVSPKQLGFYLIPAIPFVVMALSAFIIENFKLYNFKLIATLKKTIVLAGLAGFISVIVLSVNLYAHPIRDKVMLEDAEIISKSIKPSKSICAGNEFLAEWSLMAYLKRYHSVELRFKNCNTNFLLSKIDSALDSNLVLAKKLNKYFIYRSINQTE